MAAGRPTPVPAGSILADESFTIMVRPARLPGLSGVVRRAALRPWHPAAVLALPAVTWARALRPGYRAAGAVGGINAGSAPAGAGLRSGIRGRGGAMTVAGVAADGAGLHHVGALEPAPRSGSRRTRKIRYEPLRSIIIGFPRQSPPEGAGGRATFRRRMIFSARTGPPGVRPGSSALAVGPRLFVDGNFVVLLHRAGSF